MFSFTKPTNLNGTELRDELRAAGVDINDDISSVSVDGDTLFLDIAEDKIKIATEIVKIHNGNTIPPEPSVEQKLASVGLNLDDLKIALGL